MHDSFNVCNVDGPHVHKECSTQFVTFSTSMKKRETFYTSWWLFSLHLYSGQQLLLNEHWQFLLRHRTFQAVLVQTTLRHYPPNYHLTMHNARFRKDLNLRLLRYTHFCLSNCILSWALTKKKKISLLVFLKKLAVYKLKFSRLLKTALTVLCFEKFSY